MGFDTPQATVVIVVLATLLLIGGAKFFGSVNVGVSR